MSREDRSGTGPLRCVVTGNGPPLLLLHGFTGTRRTWDGQLAAWRDAFRCVAVDLLGHGASEAPGDQERYRMERAVEDLRALLDAIGIRHAHVLGYSMGARVALHLALAAPDRVRGLIIESGSPGLRDPRERADRLASDGALAARIEREGVEAFAAWWERQPLFATQAALPPATREAVRAQRLGQTTAGLANSLRGMGPAAHEPLWDRLGEIRAPTLVVSGELDPRYRRIGEEMVALLPGARHVVVGGSGHAVHLERPAEFARSVRGFLAEVGAADRDEEDAMKRR